jgi:branched-chain amino acid transport system ATP-binding protein
MAAIICLEHVAKRFGALVAMDDLSLQLEEREALGVIGPNGAGKTTMFNIVTGSVRADRGSIFFEGREITHLRSFERCRRGISRSFQIPCPFAGMTVFENLLVGATFGDKKREREAYDSCLEVLETTGLLAKANVKAGSLTLLDRKRLELARALTTKPTAALSITVRGSQRSTWVRRAMPSNGKLLETRGLVAFYGDFQALFGIDLWVEAGETIAVIGSNGACKSTLLKSIMGLLKTAAQSIRFEGEPIGGGPAHRIVARGIAIVPEGRRLFPSLTVEENLLMGGYGRRRGSWNLSEVYKLFPVLQERRNAPSNTLSGGQQQMAAVGRALMANPKVLLCDEISLGLAPLIIKDLYATLRGVAATGVTVVVVEQDIRQAMAVADRVYCLQEGRVALEGQPFATAPRLVWPLRYHSKRASRGFQRG